MKKEMEELQASALINRADIARNETYTAMLSAQETLRMATEAHRQACEMREIVRSVVGELMEEEDD